MSIQLEIKKRESDADNMFKPIKDIINLLKSYNVEFDINIYKRMEQLPMEWSSFKTLAAQCDQDLAAVKEYQRNYVTQMITLFSCRLNCFRDDFVKKLVRKF